MSDAIVIKIEDRRRGETMAFEGADLGGIEASFIIDRSQPGSGPALHWHPYGEIWIVDEGDVSFTAGERTLTAGAGSIVVVPGGTPHCFTNVGATPLRMVCIHPRARKETEWL